MNNNLLKFTALGTHWFIRIFDENLDYSKIFTEVKTLAEEFEQKYSRFLPDSLISQLNKNKVLENPPEEFLQMLKYAQTAREKSFGYFDIRVGSILEKIGYDSDYTFKVSEDEVSLKLDDDLFASVDEVRISKKTKIDFGGFGKGWLIDKIKSYLLSQDVQYFIINGGGDVYVSSKFDQSIRLLLESPFDEKQAIGEIFLKNYSLSCSASNRRRWKDSKTNQERHHLINVKSGKSSDNVVAVFTHSKNAADADALSTALFSASPKLVKKIAENFNSEFLLILQGGKSIRSLGFEGELYK